MIRDALNEITEANGPKVPLTLAFDGDFAKPKFAKAIKKLDNYKDSQGNNLYTPTIRLDRDLDNQWAGFTVEKTKKELTFFLIQNLNKWRETFGKPCTHITVGPGCPSNIIGVIKAGGINVVVPGGLLSGVFKHGKDALNPQKVSAAFIQKSGDKEYKTKVSDNVLLAAKKLSEFGFYLVNAEQVDKIEASINNHPEKNLNANEETNSPNTPDEDQDEGNSNLFINPDDISDPDVQAVLFKYLEEKNNPANANKNKLNKDIDISGTTVTEEEAKKKLLEEQTDQQVNKKTNDITDAQNSTAEQTKNGNKEGEKGTADGTSNGKEGDAEANKDKKEPTEGDNGKGREWWWD